jgi:hypothetical protein
VRFNSKSEHTPENGKTRRFLLGEEIHDRFRGFPRFLYVNAGVGAGVGHSDGAEFFAIMEPAFQAVAVDGILPILRYDIGNGLKSI